MPRFLLLIFVLTNLPCLLCSTAARAEESFVDALSRTEKNSGLLKLGDSRANVYRVLGSPRRPKWDFGDSIDLGVKQWPIRDARFPFDPAQTLFVVFDRERVIRISLEARPRLFWRTTQRQSRFLYLDDFPQLPVGTSFCLEGSRSRCPVFYAPPKRKRALPD